MTFQFISITDKGVALLHQQPPRLCSPGKTAPAKPVTVAVHHDMTLELHGQGFSASTKLSPGDVLGLISMLGYLLRDHLEVDRGVR